MLLNSFDPTRYFQFDYVLFDAIFLIGWLIILIRNKRWHALSFGVFCSFVTYAIDAFWWWNAPYNGTYIREYFIGCYDVHLHPELLALKFACDFMMCISYSLYAFPWMWIMYEYITKSTSGGGLNKEDWKSISFYTLYYFGAWIALPFLMYAIPLNNTIVYTVRHMGTQIIVWIVNPFIGYAILAAIYLTPIIYKIKPDAKKQKRIIVYVFIVGCLEAFFMEFPLFISGIRPPNGGILVLIIEIFMLVNQGAPYLFLAYDIVLPLLVSGLKSLFNIENTSMKEGFLEVKRKEVVNN